MRGAGTMEQTMEDAISPGAALLMVALGPLVTIATMILTALVIA